MSQTLYRKYRSQRFADIVGQPHVVKVLQNSIVRGRLNHAYLFSGPRGTGKTSIARIFAKALNCLNPQDGDACGVCANCTAITQGSVPWDMEIDAASNRGIDDIRELRDHVAKGIPQEWKHKVYIIDEVHMITPQGFNALLKTLEEPPSHVIFCLCTTEANKVPITILSRCIRFDFQRLPLEALAAHLESIALAERFTLEPGCALKLARLAEGSARDAISLLDQLTVFCDSCITGSDIDELFQLGDPAQVRSVVDSLLDGQSGGALEAWENMLARGVDAGTFLLQLADELKGRYLAEPKPRAKSALEAIWQGLNLLKYDNFPALLVELTLIQAAGGQTTSSAQPRPADNSPRPAERVAQFQQEKRAAPAPVQTQPAPLIETPKRDPVVVPESAPVSFPEAGAVALAASAVDTEIDELLETFRDKVNSLRMTTYVLLLRGVRALRDGNRMVLFFEDGVRQAMSYAGQPDNLAVLREAARQLFGQHTVIELRREGEAPSLSRTPESDPEPETSAPSGGNPIEPGPPAILPTGAAGALESSSANGAGERLATFDDALRIFGSGAAGSKDEER